MEQPDSVQPATDDLHTEETNEEKERINVPLIVFAVTSVAFLAYIAIGTIEARIWRFGRLNFEDRTIRHVWGYFGDRLPELPGQAFISGLYWAALAVMVIGTVLGLWLFLGTPDDDPATDAHAIGPEQRSVHD